MSDQLLLNATLGRAAGTRASRRLRREGRIPAVVYGLDNEPVSVSVAWPDLRVALNTDAGINALITLDIEGEQQLSIVKDLQRHPVRRDVIHVDFLRVTTDQEIEVDVPLVLVGEAVEVTRANGMVDQTLYSLTVSAKPADVPDEIEVDISELTLGDSIKVGEVVLPPGVVTATDPDDSVATSLVTRSTREAMAAAEAASAEAAITDEDDDETPVDDADADDS
ncbi:MAG: 50S ribosomal protein L25 [Acidimicrobiaceae bacterium]|nr:50S ribosomal protein L25 [Acidimicrobiaceae bacterium]MYD06204.1 50S ribosomal protein L25 [Acidimicrobiaceae bacterium]MYI57450.1 50S ribosomal protein L25 [Acidimicrobiaceae bacterium]